MRHRRASFPPIARLAPLALPLLLLSCRSQGSTATPAEVTTSVPSARPAEWGYTGGDGPDHWSELHPAYAACKAQRQSPIDLSVNRSGAADAHAEESEPSATQRTLRYQTSSLKIAHHENVTDILDNGHTIQITVDKGSTLVTDKGSYELKQFHFHTPSEHTVNGESFPMEAHFVHQSSDGSFAVVSVMFKEGPSNDNLATLIANFPEKKGDARDLPSVTLDLGSHLPAASAAYRYDGSFTTPPCTEGVEWLVFRTPLTASREQLQAFASRLDHNNRPIQARNERAVTLGTLTTGAQQ